MSILTMTINDCLVNVEFTFWKGYEATWDDPGCPDEAEVGKVWYPANSKEQVNILPVMHEDDIQAIYDHIYNCAGNESDD